MTKWYFYFYHYCINIHFPTSYLLKAIVQTYRMVATFPSSQYFDCQLCLLTKLNYRKGRVAVQTRKQLSPAAALSLRRASQGRNPSCQLPAASLLTLLDFCSQQIGWSPRDVGAQGQRQVCLKGNACFSTS